MGIKEAHKRIEDRKNFMTNKVIPQIELEGDYSALETARGIETGLDDALEIIEGECPEVLELPNLIGYTEVPHGLFYKAVKKVVDDVLRREKWE